MYENKQAKLRDSHNKKDGSGVHGGCPCYYRFTIPHDHPKGPVQIDLYAKNGDVWVGELPYSRWANKRQIFFSADKDGTPLKSIRTGYPVRWGFIPHPSFKKKRELVHA